MYYDSIRGAFTAATSSRGSLFVALYPMKAKRIMVCVGYIGIYLCNKLITNKLVSNKIITYLCMVNRLAPKNT